MEGVSSFESAEVTALDTDRLEMTSWGITTLGKTLQSLNVDDPTPRVSSDSILFSTKDVIKESGVSVRDTEMGRRRKDAIIIYTDSQDLRGQRLSLIHELIHEETFKRSTVDGIVTKSGLMLSIGSEVFFEGLNEAVVAETSRTAYIDHAPITTSQALGMGTPFSPRTYTEYVRIYNRVLAGIASHGGTDIQTLDMSVKKSQFTPGFDFYCQVYDAFGREGLAYLALLGVRFANDDNSDNRVITDDLAKRMEVVASYFHDANRGMDLKPYKAKLRDIQNNQLTRNERAELKKLVNTLEGVAKLRHRSTDGWISKLLRHVQ